MLNIVLETMEHTSLIQYSVNKVMQVFVKAGDNAFIAKMHQ